MGDYFMTSIIVTAVALAILLVVAACNYLGDSLRDALDPRHAMHKEPVL